MFTGTAFRHHYTTGFVTVHWCQSWGGPECMVPPPTPSLGGRCPPRLRRRCCNAVLASLPASTLAPFQRVLYTPRHHACTVLDFKPRNRVTPSPDCPRAALHACDQSERIQYKLCLMAHKSPLRHAGVHLGHTNCRCTCSDCSARFVVGRRPRSAADPSTNRRRNFLCRRTASMEQAADRAEATAVDH